MKHPVKRSTAKNAEAATAKKLIVGCAAFVGGIWIFAVVPLISLLIEYRGIPLCAASSLAWFVATLYGSFFIYPVVIGALSMVALVLPLATALSLTMERHTTRWFVAFYIVTTLVIAALEFYASPNGLFQIMPRAISNDAQFLQGLVNACSGSPFAGYGAQLPWLIAAGQSYTGLLYYPGFVAQVLMQNALFVVFVAFILHRKEDIVSAAPYLPNAIFFGLGYAIFLGSIWCLFRLAYRHDMLHLLGIDNPFIGDYVIVVLYLVVLAVFVAYFQFNLDQLAKTISTIGQFLVFAGGVAFVQFNEADRVFGTQASTTSIFALFLLFIFISALALAFLLRPAQP